MLKLEKVVSALHGSGAWSDLFIDSEYLLLLKTLYCPRAMDNTTGMPVAAPQPPPGIAGAGAPATPARRPGMHGGTPGAKRPTTLEGLLAGAPAAGPQMDATTLNDFIYKLYYDLEAVKKFGFGTNETLDDHAV